MLHDWYISLDPNSYLVCKGSLGSQSLIFCSRSRQTKGLFSFSSVHPIDYSSPATVKFISLVDLLCLLLWRTPRPGYCMTDSSARVRIGTWLIYYAPHTPSVGGNRKLEAFSAWELNPKIQLSKIVLVHQLTLFFRNGKAHPYFNFITF